MAPSLFLIASISLAFLCISGQADLIGEVCATAINPPLCNQVLRSDPRSRGADLWVLGEIITAKSLSAVETTSNIAKTFDNGSTKGKAETCMETCGDAVGNLKDCEQLIKARNKARIGDLRTYGSAALSNVDTCDDEFGAGEPAKLKQASKYAQDVISGLLAIAARLK